MHYRFIYSPPDESTVRYEETNTTEPIFNTGEESFPFRGHLHAIFGTNVAILVWKKLGLLYFTRLSMNHENNSNYEILHIH